MEISRINLSGEYFPIKSRPIWEDMGNAVLVYDVFENDTQRGTITVTVSRTCLGLWKHALDNPIPEEFTKKIVRAVSIVLEYTALPISLNDLIQIYPNVFKLVVTTDQDFYDEQARTLYVPSGNSPAQLIKHIALNDNESDEKLQLFILDTLKSFRDWSYNRPPKEITSNASEMPFDELSAYWFFTPGKLLSNLESLEEEKKIKVQRSVQGIVGISITQFGIKAISQETNSTHEAPAQLSSNQYIKPELIKALEGRQGTASLNFRKLIKLTQQLNQNFALSNEYASAMLIRSIVDHIPPMLGKSTFEEVVNNYQWSRTDKDYMRQLADSKAISHDALHRQISSSQDLIEITDLPPGIYLNRLLQECLDPAQPITPKSDAKKPSSKPAEKLSATQRQIFEAFISTGMSEITVFAPRAGTNKPIYHGLGPLAEGYEDVGIFRASFNDLVDKKIFTIDRTVGIHDTPVYVPTSKFYDLKKQMKL